MDQDQAVRLQRERALDLVRVELENAYVSIRAGQTMTRTGSVGAVFESIRIAAAAFKRAEAILFELIADSELPGQGVLGDF